MKKLNLKTIRTIPNSNSTPEVSSTPPTNMEIITSENFKFNKSVAICGTVRNGADNFEVVSKNVKKIASWFKSAIIIVVESDSDDKTLDLWSKEPNVNLISLGKLRDRIPSRTQRIALCRNTYLDAVLGRKKDIDLMINIDLDDILTEELDDFLFENCMLETEYPNWDGLFANQSYRYYDIWALRDENIDFDCFEAKHVKKMSHHECIGKFQRHIPRNSGFLPVKSAFGGMGIYKVSSLDQNCRYVGKVNNSNREICEHVPLNLYLTGKGCKLFIDSSMVLITPPSFSKYYV
jgi:hypothetical protein